MLTLQGIVIFSSIDTRFWSLCMCVPGTPSKGWSTRASQQLPSVGSSSSSSRSLSGCWWNIVVDVRVLTSEYWSESIEVRVLKWECWSYSVEVIVLQLKCWSERVEGWGKRCWSESVEVRVLKLVLLKLVLLKSAEVYLMWCTPVDEIVCRSIHLNAQCFAFSPGPIHHYIHTVPDITHKLQWKVQIFIEDGSNVRMHFRSAFRLVRGSSSEGGFTFSDKSITSPPEQGRCWEPQLTV